MKNSKGKREQGSMGARAPLAYTRSSARPPRTLATSHPSRGFTLVEMMVAVSLFAVVMTISVGSLLSLVDANRKAQALQSVMNNLNIALDGMVRNIRMGTNYHCGGAGEISQGVLASPEDCTNSPGQLVAFEAFDGDPGDNSDQWVYWLEDGRLYKSENSRAAGTALPITAPEITIDSFKVYVTGSDPLSEGNTVQPKVVIVIQGTAGAAGNAIGIFGSSEKIRTTFNIQAVASQRLLDL